MSIPDWVKQLPLEQQARLIAEQQRIFNAMMQQQLQIDFSPYINAMHLQFYQPHNIYIAGQVFDGETGRKKP